MELFLLLYPVTKPESCQAPAVCRIIFNFRKKSVKIA